MWFSFLFLHAGMFHYLLTWQPECCVTPNLVFACWNVFYTSTCDVMSITLLLSNTLLNTKVGWESAEMIDVVFFSLQVEGNGSLGEYLPTRWPVNAPRLIGVHDPVLRRRLRKHSSNTPEICEFAIGVDIVSCFREWAWPFTPRQIRVWDIDYGCEDRKKLAS